MENQHDYTTAGHTSDAKFQLWAKMPLLSSLFFRPAWLLLPEMITKCVAELTQQELFIGIPTRKYAASSVSVGFQWVSGFCNLTEFCNVYLYPNDSITTVAWCCISWRTLKSAFWIEKTTACSSVVRFPYNFFAKDQAYRHSSFRGNYCFSMCYRGNQSSRWWAVGDDMHSEKY